MHEKYNLGLKPGFLEGLSIVRFCVGPAGEVARHAEVPNRDHVVFEVNSQESSHIPDSSILWKLPFHLSSTKEGTYIGQGNGDGGEMGNRWLVGHRIAGQRHEHVRLKIKTIRRFKIRHQTWYPYRKKEKYIL